MPTYIVLIKFNDDATQRLKEERLRTEIINTAYEAVGAKLKGFYMVYGKYDAVAITEAPDSDTATLASLFIGIPGTARPLTMRAFTEQEYLCLLEAVAA